MKKILVLFVTVFIFNNNFAQQSDISERTKIMTLGVFHFAYPNLDAVKTKEKNKISVLEEPFQSQIIAVCNAISEFKPLVKWLEQRKVTRRINYGGPTARI